MKDEGSLTVDEQLRERERQEALERERAAQGAGVYDPTAPQAPEQQSEKSLIQELFDWIAGLFTPKQPEQEGGTSATSSGEEAKVNDAENALPTEKTTTEVTESGETSLETRPPATRTTTEVPYDRTDPRSTGDGWRE